MWEYVEERIRQEAVYMIENQATVRQTAIKFNISKSTVHKDMVERLFMLDKMLYVNVRKILDQNLSIRHIRGGMATKRKYYLEAQKKKEPSD